MFRNLFQFYTISIHTPTKGATNEKGCIDFAFMISIHTPTKGATRSLIIVTKTIIYFNPHSHEGSDLTAGRCLMNLSKFQSTLPRRERLPTYLTTVLIMCNFNPHSHEGSDLLYLVLIMIRLKISIHTPTKGATRITIQKCCIF